MRILLAIDGSAGAETAVGLVASLPWQGGTSVRAVTVLPPVQRHLGRAGAAHHGMAATDRQSEVAAVLSLAEVGARLERAGLGVERVLPRGRPADAIVRAAARSGADLVVTGSRGRGRLTSMLLGSVAAEVAATSPSPVLVARSETIASIVVAVDGSAHARAVEDFLLRLPVTRRCRVLVLTVVGRSGPWPFEADAPAGDPSRRAQAAEEAAANRVADASGRRLQQLGIDVDAQVRTGDPSGEILAAAAARGADLIALGSRGHRGMRRLLMGSVARNVLEHSTTSVLIARALPPRSRGMGMRSPPRS